jgi:hypothetical protein
MATCSSAPETSVSDVQNTSRVLPNPPRITSPIADQPAAQNLASNTTASDGADSFISLLSPSCGTTSGGEQIVLVVANLPPPTTLFARFGDNFVATVRYKCLKRLNPPNHSLVLPFSWGPRLQPTSSRSTWHSRGNPLSSAFTRCTSLCAVAGQVHIRIGC